MDAYDTPAILMECPYCDGDGCTTGACSVLWECPVLSECPWCAGEGWC